MKRKPLVRDGLVFCWPDTHVPHQHRAAVNGVLEFIANVQPDEVLLMGDFLDCEPVSRWAADTLAEKGADLQHEIDEGRKILENLRDVYDGRISWLPGNHEERLAKWGRTRGKAVFGLRALTVPKLLGFDDLEIATPGGDVQATVPYEFAPGVVAVHGERLGAKAGYSVTKEMERIGQSVVIGHCHRLAVVHKTTPGYRTFGLECGHLMDQSKAEYLTYSAADWQMGFGLVEIRNGRAVPHAIPIDNQGRILSALWT